MANPSALSLVFRAVTPERSRFRRIPSKFLSFRPPLIDCLFPVRRPRLLLPAASLPLFRQVRHMRMRKSIKRYVTVLERITMFNYPGRSSLDELVLSNATFRCDICSNDWKNCEDFAKWNNNNNRPPACIRPRLWDRKQPIKYSWPYMPLSMHVCL